MATNEPLHIDAGATYGPRQFTYTNDDGTAFDFTGYTASMQVRSVDGLLVLSKTPTINTATGEISFTLSATETSTLTSTRYRWSLELASASATIRLLQGRVTVSPEVVR